MSAWSEWLGRRRPAPPGPLMDRLHVPVQAGETVASALRREGLRELSRTMERTGRVRESAFHLLVADALLTYACEAALEEDDPRERLAELVHAVGGTFR